MTKIFFYPDITIHTPIESPSRGYSKYFVFRNIYINFWSKKAYKQCKNTYFLMSFWKILFMAFYNKYMDPSHTCLVEYKFPILFLLNALNMMHFEQILTILLYFFVRVPDRLYFTILHLYSMCLFSSQKEPLTQCKYFILR